MSIQIKILGPGCAKCKTLEQITREVVAGKGYAAEITKIEDIMEIMNYGILSTPGLVINEKVVMSGRLPSREEIQSLIEKHING